MLRGAPASSPSRQRRAQSVTFPAPVAGWVSNRNLAASYGRDVPQGAEVLDNFFPTASSAILRRGSTAYAQLGEGTGPTRSLFTYVVGNNRKLFGATDTAIFDITSITNAYNYTLATNEGDTISAGGTNTLGENSTAGRNVFKATKGGDWITVQFANTGGVSLFGVNGASEGFRYDGTTFTGLDTGTPAITFPQGSSLTTADLAYVWAYKRRLFFAQKQSMTIWYLDVDAIGGVLTELPLGGEFAMGGSVLLGETWSLESGQAGGLSEQCVFLSTEGEAVIFQGDNPGEAASWSRVGAYRVGRPLGKRGFIRAGGDLVIATSIGFVALSKAIQVDIAAIAPTSVSASIEVAWNDAVLARGGSWPCILWPEGQMVAVAPPTTNSTSPVVFVSNAITGAWARFTNWDVTCFVVFNGRLLFGSTQGRVFEAMVGGTDEGIPYTGAIVPLFTDGGAPSSIKAARLARLTCRSEAEVKERMSCRFDFDRDLPPPPDVMAVPAGNEWNGGVWGEALWSVERESIVIQRRHSVSGRGYRLAPSLQVTSGTLIPLDLEVIALDVTFDVGDIFT